MALTSGTRLGPYEILSAIGAGGMGEVYRARDVRLDREVAIKLISEGFAADTGRTARFLREAKLLASLNHPNIAHVYGLEQVGEERALVMELVAGEDLSARIARGPIPVDDTLAIALQIADAVAAAHEQGIIHRDLKPANIKVRPNGSVKVLDFGLARQASSEGAQRSVTMTASALTEVGTILGTAAYMSPEQVRGGVVDKRSDIWAFGCVLFEMLAGRGPFSGGPAAEVMAAVLSREPDYALLPAGVPPGLRRLIRRCLQKPLADRLRDIGDARLELLEAVAPAEPEASNAAAPGRNGTRRGRNVIVGTMALLGIALAASLALPRAAHRPPAEVRLEVVTPPTSEPLSVAVSPDGQTLAFVATSDGVSELWLRPLDATVPHAIPGTAGAQLPFWAPDSQSIGFFADDKLWRVSVVGGSVQRLASAPLAQGGTWSRSGVILFAALGRPISRVPATGGEPVPLSGLAQQGSDFFPQFLPDGKHFLYYVRGNSEVRGTYVGQLDAAIEPQRLLDNDATALFVAPGHMMFTREGTLFAQAFDPAGIRLSGAPFAVAEAVTHDTEELGLSASDTGVIVYRPNSEEHSQFTWFDRSGQVLSRLGDPTEPIAHPSLSADGRRIALYRSIGGNTDLWLVDARRGVFSRFTSDRADDVFPLWSPDGSRIVFSSNRTGVHNLYQKPVAGGESETLLWSSAEPTLATDWSPDGRFILFRSQSPKTGADLWALALEGTPKAFPVVQTAFDELGGRFSPDGRWIAYQSNESGQSEVYVQPFPGPGNKWLVSTNGGSDVQWRADGGELFYTARNGELMAVPIRLAAGGATPEVGVPTALFTPSLGGAIQRGDSRHHYMVARDGQHILVPTLTGGATAPIAVILNWTPRPRA